MNSMLTAERFGRWENLWASVMWFSTFFKWVVRSGASGGLAWHTVSSRAMETHAGSIPFSAILLFCGKCTGIDSQWAPLSGPGSGTHSWMERWTCLGQLSWHKGAHSKEELISSTVNNSCTSCGWVQLWQQSWQAVELPQPHCCWAPCPAPVHHRVHRTGGGRADVLPSMGGTQLCLRVPKGSPGITPAWPGQGSGDTGMGCQASRLLPVSSSDKACSWGRAVLATLDPQLVPGVPMGLLGKT